MKNRMTNKQEGKALFISKHVLDTKRYDDYTNKWEFSAIRRWLNDYFLRCAFTKEEQEQIVTADVSADRNPKGREDSGKATKDKVFLLSIPEAKKYFGGKMNG